MKRLLRALLFAAVFACGVNTAPAWAQNKPVSGLGLRGAVAGTDQLAILPSGAATLLGGYASDLLAYIQAAPYTGPGVFTNTAMGETLTSSVNGLSFLAEYQASQGVQYSTEGGAFGVSVPITSTIHQADGVAGYVNNYSTATNAVGGYFSGRGMVNGSQTWGANIVGTTTTGLTAGLGVIGLEVDAGQVSTSAAYNGIYGVTAAIGGMGGGAAYVVGSTAFFASGNAAKQWFYGFQTAPGFIAPGGAAFVAGTLAAAGSATSASQAVQFNSLKSSALVTTQLASDSAGDLIATLTPGNHTALYVENGGSTSGWSTADFYACADLNPKCVWVGFDAANNIGYLGAVQVGVSEYPITLDPDKIGAGVGVATGTVPAAGKLTISEVNGVNVTTGGLTVTGAVGGTGFSNYLASPPAIGVSAPGTGNFTTLSIGNALYAANTAPAYSSGFSTGATTIVGNAAVFTVAIGATPAATGVLTMPTGNLGWNCSGVDRTTAAGTIRETAASASSVTFALASTVAADVLQFQCGGY